LRDGVTALGASPKGVEHHLEGTEAYEERTCQQSKVLRGIGHGEIGSSNQIVLPNLKKKLSLDMLFRNKADSEM
jgi:hypothetical protein